MKFTAALDALASRRVVLFGGKGGVGKTTISAAAARHYAKTRKVVLFTTDPASNLKDLFSGNEHNLTIEELDANALYARFLEKNVANLIEIGDRGTYLDREELRRFFELSLPGVDEIMAWMRIGELAEQNARAMIVVDTAPTGHALRMLAAGDHFRQFALALDTMEEKHRGMVQQFTRRRVRDEIDAYIEQFQADAERRRALLSDPARSAFVPVFLSEPWVVEQTLRLIEEVREGGLDVPYAILNRAIGKPDCGRCRERVKREATARARITPLEIVEFPRSCVPLGTSVSPLPPGEGAAKQRVRGVLTIKSRLLFLAGKGGVGKTTFAASIAVQRARANPAKRYTVISVDPAHALRDVFAHEAPPANLAVEMIDTRQKWRKFRETLGAEIERAIQALAPTGLSVVYDTEALQKLVEIAPPGADELFAVSRLADLARDESQAGVIVDTAPTGHFLRLLDLPHTAGEWVREFMRILLHYREVIQPGTLGEELVNASRSLKSLEETLHSERAAVVVVTRPEGMVVAETRRLLDEIRRKEIALAAIIANYVTPETECPCDRSMRSHELALLRELGAGTIVVHRQDAPVTRLDDLAALLKVTAD